MTSEMKWFAKFLFFFTSELLKRNEKAFVNYKFPLGERRMLAASYLAVSTWFIHTSYNRVWGPYCKARFRRRSFHEPNLIHWIKYMKKIGVWINLQRLFQFKLYSSRSCHFSLWPECQHLSTYLTYLPTYKPRIAIKWTTRALKIEY